MGGTNEQVRDHRWPSGGEQPIAGLRVPIDGLAAQAGLKLETWEEEGLGFARGAWCRLPSGRVVQLYELEHAPDPGVRLTVSADLYDIATVGSRTVVDEVLRAFGLGAQVLAWSQDAATDARVAEQLRSHASARAG